MRSRAFAALALAAAACSGSAPAHAPAGGTPTPSAASPTTPAGPPAVDPGEAEARARAWFTDTLLVDQEGREVRFYSDLLAGRVVAIDFIFTRCEMACPLLTEKMNRVRTALGPAFGKEVSFLSMSVDPARDTPQDLARFAKVHRAVHPAWTWVTGREQDMRRVLKRLGEWVDDPDQHSTEFIVGNARTRHWIKVRPDAPVETTVLQLKQLIEEDAGRGRPPAARVARE